MTRQEGQWLEKRDFLIYREHNLSTAERIKALRGLHEEAQAAGFDLLNTDYHGMTALLWTTSIRDDDQAHAFTQALLELGADPYRSPNPNLRELREWPVLVAVTAGNPQTADTLLFHMALEGRDKMLGSADHLENWKRVIKHAEAQGYSRPCFENSDRCQKNAFRRRFERDHQFARRRCGGARHISPHNKNSWNMHS